MRKTICFSLLVTLGLLLTSTAAVAQARTRTSKPAAARLMNALPPSDAVATVKLRRVLDEGVPKLLAGNPSKIAEINSELEQFKTKTGLDPRSFEELALGISYLYPAEGVTKFRTVALASGNFSAGALVAAGRIASDGKYREAQHRGKTIYIFNLNQQIKLFGLFDLKLGELAVAPLDANTLALGDLEAVQAAINVGRGARANTELIALATKDPGALLGFGSNISEELRNSLSLSNNGIAREITAVRQIYGAIGLTEADVQVMLAARTVDEPSARNLGNTVEALKQFAGFFVNRLSASKAALAKSALNGLKITSQGNELLLRTAVSQAEIAPLVSGR